MSDYTVPDVLKMEVTSFRCTCNDAFNLMTGRPICPAHSTACAPMPTLGQTVTTATWPPVPTRLADEDVERIAKRVVELMRGSPKP